MVEIRHERERPRPRQPPETGLQPPHPAQRRRHPDRPVGVRAQRERHQPRRHRRRRPARRAAGDAAGVVRIARGPVMDVLGHEPVGELVHVECAHQHRARRPQPRHRRRVARGRRRIPQDPRPPRSWSRPRCRTGSSPRTARPRAARHRAPPPPPGSTASASASARSPSTAVNALSVAWLRSIRASASATSARAVTRPACTAAAMASAPVMGAAVPPDRPARPPPPPAPPPCAASGSPSSRRHRRGMPPGSRSRASARSRLLPRRHLPSGSAPACLPRLGLAPSMPTNHRRFEHPLEWPIQEKQPPAHSSRHQFAGRASAKCARAGATTWPRMARPHPWAPEPFPSGISRLTEPRPPDIAAPRSRRPRPAVIRLHRRCRDPRPRAARRAENNHAVAARKQRRPIFRSAIVDTQAPGRRFRAGRMRP